MGRCFLCSSTSSSLYLSALMDDKSIVNQHIERVSESESDGASNDVSLTGSERQRAEKALVRKLDTRLLGSVVLIYTMNYIDVSFFWRLSIEPENKGACTEDRHYFCQAQRFGTRSGTNGLVWNACVWRSIRTDRTPFRCPVLRNFSQFLCSVLSCADPIQYGERCWTLVVANLYTYSSTVLKFLNHITQ